MGYNYRFMGCCSLHIFFIGCVANPSSDSRPFHFLQNNLLVSINRNGVRWNYFHNIDIHQYLDRYNLQQLFTHLAVPQTLSDDGVIHSEGCNFYPIAWVKSLFERAYEYNDIKLSYGADIAVSDFEKILVPFMASLQNRPDGIVFRHFKDWKVPIFMIEIHSSPSVAKTAVDIIDQLRLLRCFDSNITKCVGFTFPKFSNDHGKIRLVSLKSLFLLNVFNFLLNLLLYPFLQLRVQSKK